MVVFVSLFWLPFSSSLRNVVIAILEQNSGPSSILSSSVDSTRRYRERCKIPCSSQLWNNLLAEKVYSNLHPAP